MNKLQPFHAAYPIKSLEKAREFYGKIMGCEEGRSDTTWVDYNFFGHQLVFHVTPSDTIDEANNIVDSKNIPIPHFGVVLEWDQWESLAQTFKDHEATFVIEPYIRFKGKPGEQGTFFVKDFNNLTLEFKTFKDMSMLFQK